MEGHGRVWGGRVENGEASMSIEGGNNAARCIYAPPASAYLLGSDSLASSKFADDASLDISRLVLCPLCWPVGFRSHLIILCFAHVVGSCLVGVEAEDLR